MEKQIKRKSNVRRNRTFRFSENELAVLEEGGGKCAGMNESKYVRELILCGGVDSTHADDRRNLIRQISGIATNVNQMAKRCNETSWIGNRDVMQLHQMLEEILQILRELFERWR